MAIPNWENNINYKKYDIIEEPDGSNIFYYATFDHNSSLSGTSGSSGSSGSSGTTGTFYTDKVKWAGILDINGDKVPHFFWKPDYNTRYSIKSEVKKIKYGDGYEQRSKANFDNILLNLDLTFSNRSYKEAVAIMHFLNRRKGYEPFIFTPEYIYTTYNYSSPLRWICKEWTHSHQFDENNIIKATFNQVPINGKFEIIR
jgi:phage-related protein